MKIGRELATVCWPAGGSLFTRRTLDGRVILFAFTRFEGAKEFANGPPVLSPCPSSPQDFITAIAPYVRALGVGNLVAIDPTEAGSGEVSAVTPGALAAAIEAGAGEVETTHRVNLETLAVTEA
ncbi:MAG: hypothetical protein ABSG86_09690 [Thermoguttaceae bacterium]|jgi:hypothetical protein